MNSMIKWEHRKLCGKCMFFDSHWSWCTFYDRPRDRNDRQMMTGLKLDKLCGKFSGMGER